MPRFETELYVVVDTIDISVSIPIFIDYDFHRGYPALPGGPGEPPSSPEEPEHVEITSAWTNLPMETRPSDSGYKPTFKYNLLPMMSEEQIKVLEEKILEKHE